MVMSISTNCCCSVFSDVKCRCSYLQHHRLLVYIEDDLSFQMIGHMLPWSSKWLNDSASKTEDHKRGALKFLLQHPVILKYRNIIWCYKPVCDCFCVWGTLIWKPKFDSALCTSVPFFTLDVTSDLEWPKVVSVAICIGYTFPSICNTSLFSSFKYPFIRLMFLVPSETL